jgi:hypothetical protein
METCDTFIVYVRFGHFHHRSVLTGQTRSSGVFLLLAAAWSSLRADRRLQYDQMATLTSKRRLIEWQRQLSDLWSEIGFVVAACMLRCCELFAQTIGLGPVRQASKQRSRRESGHSVDLTSSCRTKPRVQLQHLPVSKELRSIILIIHPHTTRLQTSITPQATSKTHPCPHLASPLN